MFILHLDSSANTQLSITRTVSANLVNEMVTKYPKSTVKHMDLAKNPLPFIDDTWFEKGHSHLTEELVDDLLKADLIVIGAPVYNFSIPASLKAYIDHIVVAGKTFAYTPEGPKGLVPAGKKVYIIAASGTPYETLSQYSMNYHAPYFKTILGFIGITDIEVLSYTARGEEEIAKTVNKAKDDVQALVNAYENQTDKSA